MIIAKTGRWVVDVNVYADCRPLRSMADTGVTVPMWLQNLIDKKAAKTWGVAEKFSQDVRPKELPKPDAGSESQREMFRLANQTYSSKELISWIRSCMAAVPIGGSDHKYGESLVKALG